MSSAGCCWYKLIRLQPSFPAYMAAIRAPSIALHLTAAVVGWAVALRRQHNRALCSADPARGLVMVTDNLDEEAASKQSLEKSVTCCVTRLKILQVGPAAAE